MKYLCRAGIKDGAPPIEDLKKAAWYLRRELSKPRRREVISNDTKYKIIEAWGLPPVLGQAVWALLSIEASLEDPEARASHQIAVQEALNKINEELESQEKLKTK